MYYEQDPYMNQMSMQQEEMGISPTKQSIKNYLTMVTGCSCIEEVDMFDTQRTRHICPGSGYISILDSGVIPVQTSRGIVNAEIFFCPNCYKLIVNKDSLTVL